MPTVNLYPVKDTRSGKTAATSNYGSNSQMLLHGASSNYRYSYMQFDLSSIPSNATCSSATLHVFSSVTGQPSVAVSLHEFLSATSTWVEDQLTWNVYKTGSTWPGGTNGGGVAGTDHASGNIGTGTISGDAGVESTISLTASAVENWFGDSTTNYGFIILPTDLGYHGVHSRDSGTSSYWPYLEVTYTLPSPSTTLTPTADTHIKDDSPTTNYGTEIQMYCDTTDALLVRFDLSSINNGATIYDAVLTFRASTSLATVDLTAYKLATANEGWTEGGATWNTIDGSTSWAGSNGGSTSGTDYDATPLGTGERFTDLTGTLISIHLDTDTISTEAGGDLDLILRATDSLWVNAVDVTTASYRPSLLIVYETVIEPDPVDATGSTVTPTATIEDLTVTPSVLADATGSTAIETAVITSSPETPLVYGGNAFVSTRRREIHVALLVTDGANWTPQTSDGRASCALRVTRTRVHLLPE